MDPLDRFFNKPAGDLLDRLLTFLPHLLTAVVILLLGFIAGWLSKVLLRRLFALLDFDARAERGGVGQMLAKGGVSESPAALLARIGGGMVVFAFLLVALGNLQLTVVEHLVERLLAYLPNIFVAALVVVLGFMVGNFVGRAVLIGAVNAGWRFAGLISRSVRYLIFALAITMALEQLGIGKETVQLAFAILFSGFVLALAIAFGLGGREVARDFLERKFREQPPGEDIRHL